MTITVVVVGRTRGAMGPVVAEYEERAARYWRMEVVEVDGGVGKGGEPDPEEVRRAEGRRILARVPEGTRLVALTRSGKGMTSPMLARFLQKLQLGSAPGVAFVVGGAFGLAQEVLSGADRRLTLSPMTLPHELARLVLAEQLYRAGTIARGEPYHKQG